MLAHFSCPAHSPRCGMIHTNRIVSTSSMTNEHPANVKLRESLCCFVLKIKDAARKHPEKQRTGPKRNRHHRECGKARSGLFLLLDPLEDEHDVCGVLGGEVLRPVARRTVGGRHANGELVSLQL